MSTREPWVDLRHSMTEITVLIENPAPVRYRGNGSDDRYVEAVLDLPTARRLRDDLIRRLRDLERVADL
jgi:hypothetical protein